MEVCFKCAQAQDIITCHFFLRFTIFRMCFEWFMPAEMDVIPWHMSHLLCELIPSSNITLLYTTTAFNSHYRELPTYQPCVGNSQTWPIGIHCITIPVHILGSFAHVFYIGLFLYCIFVRKAAYFGLLGTEVNTVKLWFVD